MKLVFASANPNKIAEIKAMLPPEIELLGLDDIGCTEDIPETADTIEGNAILKADYVTKNYGYDCFSDDSGLEVVALDGAPGVYSARYAGEAKDANANMDKLLDALQGEENRGAQFKTVIALNLNGKQYLFDGIVRGQIIEEKLGDQGFGYDPIFIPEGKNLTFAQIPMREKAAMSHRGIAFSKLVSFLKK
ncbi:non-canonical purine NTP diphosphatase [Flavobacterium sp. MAH-1]|uniref:dITP/XTP pyrophosphatase n=1 Tax=Flavobacterium agri TaxID=2743471 RepID=A0A7Y9C5F7_9FLAO|nr:non-canonical purine NTP diphosphatase [Flavobacterium agri]NUY79294.1 non-canonical purine NTP diphosphatase [Flavobacterium agri]NYA69318.1 non-canonical purine NTP diphosphatase [Flavobacterium agri]